MATTSLICSCLSFCLPLAPSLIIVDHCFNVGLVYFFFNHRFISLMIMSDMSGLNDENVRLSNTELRDLVGGLTTTTLGDAALPKFWWTCRVGVST